MVLFADVAGSDWPAGSDPAGDVLLRCVLVGLGLLLVSLLILLVTIVVSAPFARGRR